jgi:hypothetical protein
VDIEELDRTIGFHDACLRGITVDYGTQTATLTLDIWVGEPKAPSNAESERLRPARLELTGLEYLVVDPPDPRYKYRDRGSVTLDLCAADIAIAASRAPALGGFAARFFVNEWNTFIHFAARDARLTWTGPE